MPRPGRQLHPHSLLTYFGAELRRLREEAGLSMAQLAESLGYSPQWIGAIELADEKPSATFAEDIDTFFKTGGMFVRLLEAHERELKRPKVPSNFPDYAALEQDASAIRKFEALLITGLLQTEEYSREILLAIQHPDTIAELLRTRMKRQEILDRQNPPRLWVTLDERVLRTKVGNHDVMRAQLKHLLEASQRPNIMIEIVPQSTGRYAGLDGSFTLLSFTDRSDVVYTEVAGAGQVIEEVSAVTDFHVRYDVIRGHALPVEQSRQLIQSILESYEHGRVA